MDFNLIDAIQILERTPGILNEFLRDLRPLPGTESLPGCRQNGYSTLSGGQISLLS